MHILYTVFCSKNILASGFLFHFLLKFLSPSSKDQHLLWLPSTSSNIPVTQTTLHGSRRKRHQFDRYSSSDDDVVNASSHNSNDDARSASQGIPTVAEVQFEWFKALCLHCRIKDAKQVSYDLSGK